MTVHLDSLKTMAENQALKRDHVLGKWIPGPHNRLHALPGLVSECVTCGADAQITFKHEIQVSGKALEKDCGD